MSCKCGSNCSCGNCGCNSKYPTLGYLEEPTAGTLVLGVAPVKMVSGNEGFEMSTREDGGCKCGSSCNCDPCNC